MFDFLKNITKGKEIREVDYLKNINIVPTMQSEITQYGVRHFNWFGKIFNINY